MLREHGTDSMRRPARKQLLAQPPLYEPWNRRKGGKFSEGTDVCLGDWLGRFGAPSSLIPMR